MSATAPLPRELQQPLKDRNPAAQIAQCGFAEMRVSPTMLQPIVEAIVGGMTLITDDPERHAHFPWHTIMTDAYGVGYEQEVGLRRPEDNKRGEKKFTFQYRPEMENELRANGVPMEDYSGFLRALSQLGRIIRDYTTLVAESLDEENRGKFPGSIAERMRLGTYTIRVLRYLKQDEAVLMLNLPDAAPHVDRSGLTPQIWASHEGLRIYGPDGKAYRVDETGYGSIAIFLGKKMAAMTRGALGFGTPHGVRDTRRDTGSRDSDRFAIVGFAHPKAIQSDADWLRENSARIKEYEKGFRL